jgi:hypothetical protein
LEKLLNDEARNSSPSSYIIRRIRSISMGKRVGEMKNAHKIFVRESGRKRGINVRLRGIVRRDMD